MYTRASLSQRVARQWVAKKIAERVLQSCCHAASECVRLPYVFPEYQADFSGRIVTRLQREKTFFACVFVLVVLGSGWDTPTRQKQKPANCSKETRSPANGALVYSHTKKKKSRRMLRCKKYYRLQKCENAKVPKNVGMMSEYSDVTLGGKVDFLRAPRRLRDEERRSIPTSIFCFVRGQEQCAAKLAGVKTGRHVTLT